MSVLTDSDLWDMYVVHGADADDARAIAEMDIEELARQIEDMRAQDGAGPYPGEPEDPREVAERIQRMARAMLQAQE